MSFTSIVKNEVSKLELTKIESIALLSSIIRNSENSGVSWVFYMNWYFKIWSLVVRDKKIVYRAKYQKRLLK